MTIPANAKPIVLRDYESQALASGRLGAIVRVVKPQPPNDTDIAGPGYVHAELGVVHRSGRGGGVSQWNPNTRPYCKGCPYYEPNGRYIYLLERDPKERMCRHLNRCKWVAGQMGKGVQTALW